MVKRMESRTIKIQIGCEQIENKEFNVMGSEQGSIMKEHSPHGHVVLKEVPLEFNNEGKTSK